MNVTNSLRIHYFLDIYRYYEMQLNTFLVDHLGEADPRTSQWPFIRSPLLLLCVVLMYAMTIIFGPKIMTTRSPFRMQNVLVIYNFVQIVLSFFIMKEVLISTFQSGYSFSCQYLDLSMNPVALRMASSIWWYHISKYLDLFDTLFFVLRKKSEQMTFLHIFHHSTMLINSYLGLVYIPGGQAIVSIFLNSFVHMIMYTYYFLSSMGPNFRTYLWWKKYLTILQLTQFFTILAHIFWTSVSDCKGPSWWLKIYVAWYVSVLILLFTNFYLSSYKKISLASICFFEEIDQGSTKMRDTKCSSKKTRIDNLGEASVNLVNQKYK